MNLWRLSRSIERFGNGIASPFHQLAEAVAEKAFLQETTAKGFGRLAYDKQAAVDRYFEMRKEKNEKLEKLA